NINVVFFFQAEDGIRDLTVTGVQTCALPISPRGSVTISPQSRDEAVSVPGTVTYLTPRPGASEGTWTPSTSSTPGHGSSARSRRSEERRVGKECGTGGGAGE